VYVSTSAESADRVVVLEAGEQTGPPAEHRRLVGRAVRGGAVLMAARLAMQLFVWIVTLVVARILHPDDYGLMTLAMVFLVLADLLAEAGFGKALIHKDALHPGDVASAFTLSVAMAVVLYGLLFVVAAPAGEFLEAPGFPLLLRVLGLLVLLVPFRSIPLALLDRDLSLGRQAAAHVICSVVQSSLVLGLALTGAGYWALAAGAMTARVLEVFVLSYAAGWRPRLVWPTVEGWGLLRFGMHASGASLLWFVYSNSDFTVVGKLLGATALGYYALSFQLISLPVQKLTANVNQAVYPVFCRLQHDRARLRDWFLRLTVLLGFFGMPVLAGMALVADDAFTVILGERWLPAVRSFQLLSVVGVLMVYSHAFPPLFNALGRPDINLRYTAVCTLLFPAAFLLGGRLAGLEGVCLAWLFLYPVLVTVLVALTRALTGVGVLDLLRAQVPIVGAVLFMAGCVLAVHGAMNEFKAGPRLVVSIVVGAAAYAGVLLLLARRTVLADLLLLVRQLRGKSPTA
jgi:O-antigen/teichoic acid export membrane protein